MPQDAPTLRFHRLIEQARLPVRADRSAAGTLPTRAFRYCEAVTAAAGFGWWVFPPSDITLLWDGESVFWQHDDRFLPLRSAQFPHFSDTFDNIAPASLQGCSPPFLTVLPEPGTVQIWTGLIVRTLPNWSVLLRAPANLRIHPVKAAVQLDSLRVVGGLRPCLGKCRNIVGKPLDCRATIWMRERVNQGETL